MILNQSQAQAVFNAMAELNNVGGLLNCRMERNITVTDGGDGGIVVFDGRTGTELYEDQLAFASAYGVC